ncbi:MAG: hypothetical protein IIA17_10145 [candidate division Zixibacteria bacterium]|nr:hypothetical protein [candidate division Zixibacteria bacterium]
MFKKFRELFGSENLLDQAYETTVKMLETDFEMYKAARHSLRESETAELPVDVRKKDKQINKFERQVRRNVLTHLTVAGNANLVPGLILVSIVIDVERIGDYTKNIVDLAERHPGKLLGGSFESTLNDIETAVIENFDLAITVLKTQDKKHGQQIMNSEEGISRQCENIVVALLSKPNDSINQQDAVAVALYSRHLKRINAHITNIVSSIVNPFPRIGFREKPKS